MGTLLQIERDAPGLELALREVFEETYLMDANGDALDQVDPETRSRMLDDMPDRSLSPGYYTQSAYLLNLASAIERGVGYGSRDLSPADLAGLQALHRARQSFEGDHPRCPACGVRQETRFAPQCRGCHTKFLRAGGAA